MVDLERANRRTRKVARRSLTHIDPCILANSRSPGVEISTELEQEGCNIHVVASGDINTI